MDSFMFIYTELWYCQGKGKMKWLRADIQTDEELILQVE
jgi:hypothetical protein